MSVASCGANVGAGDKRNVGLRRLAVCFRPVAAARGAMKRILQMKTTRKHEPAGPPSESHARNPSEAGAPVFDSPRLQPTEEQPTP